MKKSFFTFAFILATLVSHAQGTIQFVNGSLTRVTWLLGGGPWPTTFPLNYGVFWAPVDGTSPPWPLTNLVLPLGTSSTTSAGIIDASAPFAIPGTQPGQTVWLQVKGWEASYGADWETAFANWQKVWVGMTDVRQVTLGQTEGPGTAIWQSASGTNPNRFVPLVIGMVPEPSGVLLVALGAGVWALRRCWPA